LTKKEKLNINCSRSSNLTTLVTHLLTLYLDETGKYKTEKCTIDLFVSTAKRFGIEFPEPSLHFLREKTLPGGHNVINYTHMIKDLNLRILPHLADDTAS